MEREMEYTHWKNSLTSIAIKRILIIVYVFSDSDMQFNEYEITDVGKTFY